MLVDLQVETNKRCYTYFRLKSSSKKKRSSFPFMMGAHHNIPRKRSVHQRVPFPLLFSSQFWIGYQTGRHSHSSRAQSERPCWKCSHLKKLLEDRRSIPSADWKVGTKRSRFVGKPKIGISSRESRDDKPTQAKSQRLHCGDEPSKAWVQTTPAVQRWLLYLKMNART